MDDKNIKKIVQREIKSFKIAALVLSVIAILTTFGNVISICNYNQLINKEKVFINKAQNTLLDLRK